MKKKQRIITALCTALCALSLAAMAAVLLLVRPPSAAPFIPPFFDPAAQIGLPDVPTGLGYGEIDATAFKASVCGVFSPAGSTADIWFTNPADNTVWLKLRVLDSADNILGETGLIMPGEYVRSVALSHAPPSGTEIVFKLMAYEPDTYRSAGAVSLTTSVS